MYYLCTANQGARQRSHGKGNKYRAFLKAITPNKTTMNIRKEATTYLDFTKIQGEVEKKVVEIVLEAQEFEAVALMDENINVVDTLNIDLYYEQILTAKHHLAEIDQLLRDRWGIITEEEYSFVLQRMNDMVEDAKSNLEKIKSIISKYD